MQKVIYFFANMKKVTYCDANMQTSNRNLRKNAKLTRYVSAEGVYVEEEGSWIMTLVTDVEDACFDRLANNAESSLVALSLGLLH